MLGSNMSKIGRFNEEGTIIERLVDWLFRRGKTKVIGVAGDG